MLNDVAAYKDLVSFFKCKSNIILIDETLLHNHAHNEESILHRQTISNSVKRKRLEDICKMVI